MSRSITGIDHVRIGVHDLQAARGVYRRLGFKMSPRGRHIGRGTANFCVMFPGSYLELLGVVDPAQFTNNLDRFLELREGIAGIAFASDDAAAAAQDLSARGIAAGAPQDLIRRLELPEGDVEPAFKLVHLPDTASPGAPAFICQHLTPALVRQSPWLEHANGARGLASVTGVVEDPGAAALAYSALFGPEAVSADPGLVEVETGAGRLRFTTPAGLDRLYPGADAEPGYPAPWLAGLRLSVASLDTTAGCLDAAGVRYLRDADTLLRVPAEFACGVVIEFTAA